MLPVLFSGCNPKQELTYESVPVPIIQPDSMVQILTDILLIESSLREMKREGRDNQFTSKMVYTEVFEKYNLTKERYENSVAYYEKNLDTYQRIYEAVITRLSQVQTEINNLSE
nr:DUF4296 domain-containing protein [Bacteroidota bacterium]